MGTTFGPFGRAKGRMYVGARNSLEDTRESRTTLDIATNRFFQLQLESTGPISRSSPFHFLSSSLYSRARAYTFICPLDRLPLYLPIYLHHSPLLSILLLPTPFQPLSYF